LERSVHARSAGSPVANPIPLVVIPCLNEAEHVARVARQMCAAVARHGGLVVVVDGGSTDQTRAIVADLARETPNLRLLDNPARRQASAVNAAVAAFGQGHTHLIRVDAHSFYPDDFVDILLAEALATGAASVVVGMIAAGEGGCSGSTPRPRTRASAMAGLGTGRGGRAPSSTTATTR
jgi:glycosyltransferase involved in cell wall biosynthesis